MSEFPTTFQSREEKNEFFCDDITLFGYEKLTSLQDYTCVTSVVYGNRNRNLSCTITLFEYPPMFAVPE